MSQSDDATLPDTGRGSQPSSVRAASADLGERYEMGAVLGRGGMGEVRLARDVRIQRDVAVKLLRSTLRDDATLGRFFREARVQGVLDHPAVVPVHDLGIDPDGNPYFVMKRLTGTTLADVITSKDPEIRARWTRRQLLVRFVDLCLGIEFAHTRGVIHRDLKPANLMLGDYGEAYVLDWGLARIASEADFAKHVSTLSGDNIGHTVAGDLLGTPGYMSPEQARGETVDWRTDVFALGCVLFEILAMVPALPRGIEGLTAVLSSTSQRPSRIVADVPPELDDLCDRATHCEATERPTARQLADGVQAYLDGDRDTERRRQLADAHAKAAEVAMAEGSERMRATAMREAGRALGLDPANSAAQYILGRLLLEVPDKIPIEALAAADAERADTRRNVLRWATYAYLGLFLLALSVHLLPVTHIGPVIVMDVLSCVTWLLTWRLSRKPLRLRSPWFLLMMFLTALMIAMSGLMFGALLLMPIYLVGAVAAFLPQSSGFRPWIVLTGLVVPAAIVFAVELFGILPSSFSFEHGALVLHPGVLQLDGFKTGAIIALTLVTQLVNSTFIALSAKAAQEAAQNRVHAQTWHMQQLIPAGIDTGPVAKVELPKS